MRRNLYIGLVAVITGCGGGGSNGSGESVDPNRTDTVIPVEDRKSMLGKWIVSENLIGCAPSLDFGWSATTFAPVIVGANSTGSYSEISIEDARNQLDFFAIGFGITGPSLEEICGAASPEALAFFDGHIYVDYLGNKAYFYDQISGGEYKVVYDYVLPNSYTTIYNSDVTVTPSLTPATLSVGELTQLSVAIDYAFNSSIPSGAKLQIEMNTRWIDKYGIMGDQMISSASQSGSADFDIEITPPDWGNDSPVYLSVSITYPGTFGNAVLYRQRFEIPLSD